MLLYQY